MTPLTKTVTRRSEAVIRDGAKRRRLVVTLYPSDTLGLRPEKTRREEFISLEAVYSAAVRMRVIQEKIQKAKTRRRKQ